MASEHCSNVHGKGQRTHSTSTSGTGRSRNSSIHLHTRVSVMIFLLKAQHEWSMKPGGQEESVIRWLKKSRVGKGSFEQIKAIA